MRILWMGCFAFTAVIFLLQVLPVTGVILMFLAAPYWSVLTINLAFALMLLDAVAGDLPKHLIVFPVLWFAGYSVATGISHLRAYELAAEILSENSAASLSFDPQQDQLIIERDNLRQDKIISDEGLIQTYALNKIYKRFDGNPNCPSVQMVSLRSYGCGSGGLETTPTVARRSSTPYPSQTARLLQFQNSERGVSRLCSSSGFEFDLACDC